MSSSTCESIIKQFVIKCVGPPPTKPSNWTKRTAGCGNPLCRDCTTINRFLISPTEKVYELPAAKERRKHLDHCFYDTKHDSWNLETIRGCSPNIWKIAKVHGEYNAIYKIWKAENDWARNKIRELTRRGGISSGVLKECLGAKDYEAVLNCRSDNLSLISTGTSPLESTNANARLNESSSSSSRKRKLGGDDPVVTDGDAVGGVDDDDNDGSVSKRARAETINGAQIIDLTLADVGRSGGLEKLLH